MINQLETVLMETDYLAREDSDISNKVNELETFSISRFSSDCYTLACIATLGIEVCNLYEGVNCIYLS